MKATDSITIKKIANGFLVTTDLDTVTYYDNGGSYPNINSSYRAMVKTTNFYSTLKEALSSVEQLD